MKLVDQMLDVKKRLAASFMDPERERLESKCEYLDRKIDELVYELYGLAKEEIAVVEGE